MRRTAALLLALLVALPAPAAAATAKRSAPVVKSVRIVSQAGDALATDRSKLVERRDRVTLHAVVEAEIDGRTVFVSPVERFELDGAVRGGPERVAWDRAKHGVLHVKWFKVEWDKRKRRSYDNTAPKWHWDRIDYAETPLASGNHRLLSRMVDVAPTLTAARADVGTMRYKVVVEHNGRTVASPGAESRHRGGVSEAVHRISRKGDTGVPLLDYAQAFFNLPYIWGSAGSTDADHQSERFVGADCADFCVAAARAAGLTHIPYGSTKTMKGTADTVARVKLDRKTGRFLKPDGGPVRIGRDIHPGDLIFGNRHVGFLTRDLGEKGILDEMDTVTHTFFAEPLEQQLRHSRLFTQHFEVLRFQGVERAGRNANIARRDAPAPREEPRAERAEAGTDEPDGADENPLFRGIRRFFRL